MAHQASERGPLLLCTKVSDLRPGEIAAHSQLDLCAFCDGPIIVSPQGLEFIEEQGGCLVCIDCVPPLTQVDHVGPAPGAREELRKMGFTDEQIDVAKDIIEQEINYRQATQGEKS